MSQHILQVVWQPSDAYEVFERAATVHAIHAVAEEFPQTVGNSALLAEWAEAL